MDWENKIMKYVIGLLALCAVGFASKSSFASLQICNNRSDQGIWFINADFKGGIHQVLNVEAQATCQNEWLSGTPIASYCSFGSWRTVGWSHVNANSCVTADPDPLSGGYVYIFAEHDDGAVYGGLPTAPFWIHNTNFTWDEYVGTVETGSCTWIQGGFLGVCSDNFQQQLMQIPIGSYTSFTVNFY
jgi:hypothetical protein